MSFADAKGSREMRTGHRTKAKGPLGDKRAKKLKKGLGFDQMQCKGKSDSGRPDFTSKCLN